MLLGGKWGLGCCDRAEIKVTSPTCCGISSIVNENEKRVGLDPKEGFMRIKGAKLVP